MPRGWRSIIDFEIDLLGSWVNPYTFPRALQVLLTEEVEVEALISEEMPLDNINGALQHVAEKPDGFVKALINP